MCCRTWANGYLLPKDTLSDEQHASLEDIRLGADLVRVGDSMEEYLTYTTEETEKPEVMRRADELGGDIEMAIRQLALEKRNQ